MSDSNSEDRRTLLESAAGFLSEPSVQDAPLTKKVEFLKEKGLTEQEIEKALKDASLQRAGNNQHPPEFGEQGNFGVAVNSDQWYEAVPPPLPKRDWKDYFILATTTVGVCYGLYEVTKRYVLPQLLPESKSKLEEDKQQIDSHFEKVDKLLETIEREQEELRSQQQERLKQLDVTILKLQSALEDTTKTRNNINFEFRDLKLQVSELGKRIEEFKFTRENSKQLVTLQNDIDSLKLLVKNSVFRNDDASNGTGGPLLSAASIPSASEILEKMKTKPKSPADEQRFNPSLPSWRSSVAHAPSTTPSPIPDWQKNSTMKDSSPDNSRLSSKEATDNIENLTEARNESGPLST